MYRVWNWADRVLGEHGDALHKQDEYFRARAEVEASHWWWMRRRFNEEMAELTLLISNLP